MDPSSGPGGYSRYAAVLRQIEAAQETDVIEQALTAARERLSMDAAYLSTIDAQHQTIDAVVGDMSAIGLVEGAAIPLEQTYCRRMLGGELPQVVPDTRAEPAARDLAATKDIGAYIGVPVTLSSGRVHGTLCCASYQARPDLGGDELRFMRVLAGIVATRVERSQSDLAHLTGPQPGEDGPAAG